ncbi:MAG: MBL fold metallo-hydrolase [Opitutales bacterium]|nr:MBL fold metallo-hydrolase [Opitutales bacterium]
MFYTDLNTETDIGSNCSVLEIGPFRILIDCGMHPKKLGRAALPQISRLDNILVDFAVLTHCHLDHLGAFPIFTRQHPNTPILCSPASKLIAKRILKNSISVMQHQREEQHIPEYPLFTYSELDRVEANLTALPVGVPKTFFEHGEQITITLYPAGHVAGAVGVMFEYRHRKIFCTGDVSFHSMETVDAASFPREKIDTLIMETTRGGTETDPDLTRDDELSRLVNDIAGTLASGGSVLIPAFAFGRMQDMIHVLLSAKNKGLIGKDVPVFCTGLGLDLADYFDIMSKKTGAVNFHRAMMKDLGVQKLNDFEEPGLDVAVQGIYLVSSGMLVERTPAWRLAANMLDHAHNLVAFVGYCDPDTPGGRLLTRTNVDELRFNDLNYIARVRATVARYALSGHTSRENMMDFLNVVEPRLIILTHGDPVAREWYEEEVAIQLPHTKVLNPVPGEEIDC